MTVYGNSASHMAARIRARPRRGVWRRILAWAGLNRAARRADARAAMWDHGAAGEAATVALLAPLARQGWYLLHDRRLPGSRANLDHVLVSPCGTAVVVLDTKRWHRGRTTALVQGRVCCGGEDRHGQIEKVAGYAARVQAAVGVPGVRVWPLLVVHGSVVAGGWLDARVPGWQGPVWVLGSGWLVPTLEAAPAVRDPRRAAGLADRVGRVLPEYGGAA